MHSKVQSYGLIFGMSWSPANALLAIMLTMPFLIFLILFITLTTQPAEAQMFTVIHQFTGGADGAIPQAGLTNDPAGNLYGITTYGGSDNCQQGCGVVFKLSKLHSAWVLTPIHTFMGMMHGDGANARVQGVVFGPDGSLYGATYGGGGISPRFCLKGCGAVFKLTPTNATRSWTETVLYRFQGVLTDVTPPVILFLMRRGTFTVRRSEAAASVAARSMNCHPPLGVGRKVSSPASRQALVESFPQVEWSSTKAGISMV